ncbi:RAD9B protein, partial [Amia calva]|nr:RAD9B protein [Amia calva]
IKKIRNDHLKNSSLQVAHCDVAEVDQADASEKGSYVCYSNPEEVKVPNAYRMGPVHKFLPHLVQKKINELLRETFTGVTYNHCRDLADKLKDDILKLSNKQGFNRNRYIVSILPLFRCLATIERNVDRCKIAINFTDGRVIFQFFCKHGLTKTHNLGFQECESLQAVFPRHLCPNVLKVQARHLGEIVMHFPVSQEEITLTVTPLKVNFKNYYEEEMAYWKKTMHTEATLHPDEFEYFQVSLDSEITFCLKELRVSEYLDHYQHTTHKASVCR